MGFIVIANKMKSRDLETSCNIFMATFKIEVSSMTDSKCNPMHSIRNLYISGANNSYKNVFVYNLTKTQVVDGKTCFYL